ncbi:MAG: hypothetical protein V8Q57_09725 [Blautia sp.]
MLFMFKKAILPNVTFGAGATFTKKERIADIYNPMTGQTSAIHYVPSWKMNENARLYDLFRMMETDQPGLYASPGMPHFEFDLVPDFSMEAETRKSFAPVLKTLRGGNDIKLTKEADNSSNLTVMQRISAKNTKTGLHVWKQHHIFG